MVKNMFIGLIVVVFLAGGSVAIAADPGDEILGLWATDPSADGGMSHVDIIKKNGKYSAIIVWLIEPDYPADDKDGMGGQSKVDRYNPDAKKKDVPIIGLEIMHSFVYKGDRSWEGGRIYDPDNGKTYKSKMRLGDDGNLHVRGYIGFSLLGRTTLWTRPENADATAADPATE